MCTQCECVWVNDDGVYNMCVHVCSICCMCVHVVCTCYVCLHVCVLVCMYS